MLRCLLQRNSSRFFDKRCLHNCVYYLVRECYDLYVKRAVPAPIWQGHFHSAPSAVSAAL